MLSKGQYLSGRNPRRAAAPRPKYISFEKFRSFGPRIGSGNVVAEISLSVADEAIGVSIVFDKQAGLVVHLIHTVKEIKGTFDLGYLFVVQRVEKVFIFECLGRPGCWRVCKFGKSGW